MTLKRLALAGFFAITAAGPAIAQDFADVPITPTLRAEVKVNGDVVRVGDLVENAGPAAQIAVFRSPDLGTTGSVPVTQVLQALRAQKVIGVDIKDIREVVVTRAARTLAAKDIEAQVAKALTGKGGLGDVANIAVNLDRDIGPLQLDAANRGDLTPVATRFDARSGRFDVVFEIVSAASAAPTRLRFTGAALETVQAAVLTRTVDRGEVLKTSDMVTERRPKSEAGSDLAERDLALGMQMRKLVRAGQPLRSTDYGKPDLVQRDQNVSIAYRTPGLTLTMRGKATENGAEGDTVSVINLQSKRVVQGTVVGLGQILVAPIAPTITAAAAPATASPPPASNE